MVFQIASVGRNPSKGENSLAEKKGYLILKFVVLIRKERFGIRFGIETEFEIEFQFRNLIGLKLSAYRFQLEDLDLVFNA